MMQRFLFIVSLLLTPLVSAGTADDIAQTEAQIQALSADIKAANQAKDRDKAARLRDERGALQADLRSMKQQLRSENKQAEKQQKRAAAEREWESYEPDRKLCAAIEYNRPDLVQRVLAEHSFDWQKKNDACFYPLGDAAARGHVEIAELLLKQQAPLAARAPLIVPVLISAVDFAAQRKDDSTTMLNLLKRFGATPFDSLEDNMAGAIVRPGDDAGKERLKREHNFTEAALTSGTSLAKAVEKGHINNLAWLLDNGASAEDAMNGRTALMIAVDAGDPDKVKLLVERGADVNRRGINFVSVLGLAEKKQARTSGKKRERYDAIVSYLKQQGATASEQEMSQQ